MCFDQIHHIPSLLMFLTHPSAFCLFNFMCSLLKNSLTSPSAAYMYIGMGPFTVA